MSHLDDLKKKCDQLDKQREALSWELGAVVDGIKDSSELEDGAWEKCLSLTDSVNALKQEIAEEEQRQIREEYALPTPMYQPPQPVYSPPLSLSIEPPLPMHTPSSDYTRKTTMSISMDIECPNCGAINEVEYDPVNLEYINPVCEECGSPLFDEEDEEDTDEEEYYEKPPAFVFTPSAPAYQEPERYQPAQGQSRLGRDIQTGRYVDIPQASRLQGLYIIGIQGFGKSGLIENLIIQDIKQNIGVCVLDPHGELIDHVLARLPDREKEEKVILLDITDKDFFFGLNLFACADPTNDREIQYTLNQVTHVFEKAFGITRANPRLYDYLYNCAYTLIAHPGYTMMDIRLLLTNASCRSKLVGNVTDADVLDFWEKYYNPLPERQQREESREILRRLNDLAHDPLRYIIGQSQSTINLQQIMDKGKILLVRLSSKRFEEATRLIGSILVAQILNAADTRLTKKQFNLYADEFQRFATEDFATLLEEARKAAIGITMAHQNRGQLELSEKQADANLKQRTLSVGNLIVFRAPTDAEDFAGQFAQEPEAAKVQVLRPQRHERKEEQVEVEVEEDIEEISQNPGEFLLSARGTHSNAQVREKSTAFLPFYLDDAEKQMVNRFLVDVMEKRIKIGTEAFILRVKELVRLCNDKRLHNLTRTISDESIAAYDRCLLDAVRSIVLHPENMEMVIQDFLYTSAQLPLQPNEQYREDCLVARWLMPRPKGSSETKEEAISIVEKAMRDHITFCREVADQSLAERLSFILDLLILCKGLADDPIKVPTGQKRLVKRIQPHITYLTHESEKITHPQPPEQEMKNRMVRELINLPLYTARVKITTATGIEEHAIRTLEPEKGIRGVALQERIARIQTHNRTPDENGLCYCRPRQEVEAEIRQRQEQCLQIPHLPEKQTPQLPENEPPISRRPPR